MRHDWYKTKTRTKCNLNTACHCSSTLFSYILHSYILLYSVAFKLLCGVFVLYRVSQKFHDKATLGR